MKILRQLKDTGTHIVGFIIRLLIAFILGVLHLIYVLVTAALMHYALVKGNLMMDLRWNPFDINSICLSISIILGYIVTSLMYKAYYMPENYLHILNKPIIIFLLIVFAPLYIALSVKYQISLHLLSVSSMLTQVAPGLLLMLTMPYFILKYYVNVSSLIQKDSKLLTGVLKNNKFSL